jgi:diguanylate cyclase (GGDEF)-like protein
MKSTGDKLALTDRLKRLLMPVSSSERLAARRRRFDEDQPHQDRERSRQLLLRYLLVVSAVVVAPLQGLNLFSYRYLAVGGVLCALGALLFIIWRRQQADETRLSLLCAVAITLGLVLLSLATVDAHTLGWLFPLVLALPLLLPNRLAIWLAALAGLLVAPVVALRFEGAAATIVYLGMVHTWLIGVGLVCVAAPRTPVDVALSQKDPVTGAVRRERLRADVKAALKLWRRSERPSTLLLLDLDGHGELLAGDGQAAADSILASTAGLLTGRLRSADVVYRYADGALMALLRNTEESQAIYVAEELRTIIEHAAHTTASIGVCDVIQVDSVDHWLSQCERASYQARSEGCNRVVIATPGDLGHSESVSVGR